MAYTWRWCQWLPDHTSHPTVRPHISHPIIQCYRRGTPEAPLWKLISLGRIISLPIMVQGSICAYLIHRTLTLILYYPSSTTILFQSVWMELKRSDLSNQIWPTVLKPSRAGTFGFLSIRVSLLLMRFCCPSSRDRLGSPAPLQGAVRRSSTCTGG